ncbi:MAG: hypothetical protein A2133_04680 [Actinobacteria bacterium RBG_16_64_13]|nr:MAG: hypothetical protein A2133_04680 [Actinobacteria bacterium RBG_16_64_13]
MAEALEPHVPTLDVELVRAACLLHDMARNRPKHALVAQNLLSNLGLGRLGAIVGAHMVLPPEQMETFTVTEEQLLYLADKIVIDDKVAGIEARAQRVLAASGQDPAAEEGARTRMQVAKIIKARVETILGRSLDEVLT